MYRRIVIAISIIYVLTLSALYPVFVKSRVKMPEYSGYSCYATYDDVIYFSDGAESGLDLYSLDPDGSINNMFFDSLGGTVAAIVANSERVYVVSEMSDDSDLEGVHRIYKIRALNTKLIPEQTSQPLAIHTDERVTDMALENGIFFLTTVSDDGSTAEVYSAPAEEILPEIDPDELLSEDSGGGGKGGSSGLGALAGGEEEEEEEEQEEPLYLDSIFSRDSGEGRFYVDARYVNGELVTRTDGDGPEGPFAHDERVINAVRNMTPTYRQLIRMGNADSVLYVTISLIILAVMVACFVLFYGKRRLVYTALLVQIVFTAMLILFAKSYSTVQSKAMDEMRKSYAKSGLQANADNVNDFELQTGENDAWYDSEDYHSIQHKMSRFMTTEGNREVYNDIFLAYLSDGMIVNSVSGRNREPASLVYGEELNDVFESLAAGNDTADTNISIAGRTYGVMAITVNGRRSTHAVVGIINTSSADYTIYLQQVKLALYLLFVYVLGSAIIFFIIWLQAADLRKLENALADVALKGEKDKNVFLVGKDLDAMWNSICEIEKRIEHVNYNRYLIYESYYRYAPKDIEKIFGKDSISEVASGDVVSLTGTLALVAGAENSDTNGRIDQINYLLSFLVNHPEEEGIIVTGNREMSVIELFFLEENMHTQNFGCDFLRLGFEKGGGYEKRSVLLYYGGFTYGVAGTDDQRMVFLLAPEARELSEIAEWLRAMRLGLVITDQVKNREALDTDCRYIGYFILKATGTKLRLFEVLDSYNKHEHQAKLADRDKFDEALKLFYAQDYYIARNRFSEILKRMPEDEVSRWYLFESERLLNTNVKKSEKNGALHLTAL